MTSEAPKPLPVGKTLGILGGGQLGLMLMHEAQRMGYKVAILDPNEDAPARRGADHFVKGAFDDKAAALKLARLCDVVTLETEHIPADPVLDAVAAVTTLVPGPLVLHTIQDRLRQKNFLAEKRLPQPAFRAIERRSELEAAVTALGGKVVLKARTGGYDGKGQGRIDANTPEQLDAAWKAVGRKPCIAEAWVDFEHEVSVILSRAANGHFRFYPVADNVHRKGILHTTTVPSRLGERLQGDATRLAAQVADAIGHVGTMAVEMFETRDGHLLVNEIAPRVHNSGHFTLGAAATSQFENHIRAVCNLPLGDARLLRPCCMLNLLGDAWQGGQPDWDRVYQHAGARLHLYGKTPARPGRKMGHVLLTAGTPSEALTLAQRIHDELHAGTQASESA